MLPPSFGATGSERRGKGIGRPLKTRKSCPDPGTVFGMEASQSGYRRILRREKSTGAMVGKPWFEPKRFGYGASPATWQGWAVTVLFLAMMILDVALIQGILRWVGGLLLFMAFVGAVYLKTGGGWRWRSGKL